jgi:16S rRNA (adenine1518-N6/adenine1519-N6)-dimethyltransferase
VAERIADAVGATADDLVCEIGAGTGALTRLLAARGGHVVALEIDRELHARLSAVSPRWGSVDVRLADARTFDYGMLRACRPSSAGRVLVAGNLPYRASKAILLRVWEARATVDAITVMLQREVAERLVAAPGGRAYGVLSVLWQVWADLALLFVVPPAAFHPPPAVESAVVRAAFRSTPRVPGGEAPGFARVVRVGFAQRRKSLANALRAGFPQFGADGVRAWLSAAGIDPARRAETLDLEEFARLARFFTGPRGCVVT